MRPPASGHTSRSATSATSSGSTAPVRTVEIEDPGPLPSLLSEPDGLLFVQDGDGLVASGTFARIPVEAPHRFLRADEALTRLFASLDVQDDVGLPGTGPVAFGAFTFDPGARGSVLIVPEVIIGRRKGRAWRTVIGSDSVDTMRSPSAVHAREVEATNVGVDRVRYQGSTMPEMSWLAAVDRAVNDLRAGAASKVVLARDRRVWSRTSFDPRRLVMHLADRFPVCQTFWIDGLVGASPEVLAARAGTELRSLVLAGTAPRGDDDTTDHVHAQRLLASDKEQREHGFAVASIREALLGRVNDLIVDSAPQILRLANVMHLATAVTATVPESMSALTLAGLLHPSAAICGTPTTEAQQMIRRLEGMNRARYSGPVGWTDARGDGQWAIALRCAELRGSRARLFAGAGIVDGSLPEAELEETRLKLRAMQSAFEA